MADNVVGLRGSKPPTSKPNEQLVANLRDLLNMAETGQLQSFIGVGFISEGLRVASWADFHDDVYQMLGAIAWLQHEYVARHTHPRD